MLGALFAALGALTFAFNNATMRRGVLTGTVIQGLALTIPVGALGFLLLAAVSGNLPAVAAFPPRAAAFMAGQGIVQFLIGRFFNYRANQLVGVNLSAPVVQLQVVVAMMLAVALLHEPFTVLQTIGTVLMLGGSFATQRHRPTPASKTALGKATADAGVVRDVPEREENEPAPVFQPRHLAGYLFSTGAAVSYGIAPLLVRQAFENGGTSAIASGTIAYLAATLVFSLSLFSSTVRRDIATVTRHNASWFVLAAVLVTMSQAFVYASLAVAPLMVVTPILQLSLVFRLFLSQWLNRDYEVFNLMIALGAAAAVIGSILVSLNTDYAVAAVAMPDALARALRFRLAGG